jgi:hypothetical protein
MIIIKLLGPIQRALNMNTLYLDKSDISISNIISYLRDRAVYPDLIDEKNILIAVNGIQSSLLPRFVPVIRTGDIVTIASLIHGG